MSVQFFESESLYTVTLFQEAQGFAHDLTGGTIEATGDFLLDKVF
jgi:hypothetical protein